MIRILVDWELSYKSLPQLLPSWDWIGGEQTESFSWRVLERFGTLSFLSKHESPSWTNKSRHGQSGRLYYHICRWSVTDSGSSSSEVDLLTFLRSPLSSLTISLLRWSNCICRLMLNTVSSRWFLFSSDRFDTWYMFCSFVTFNDWGESSSRISSSSLCRSLSPNTSLCTEFWSCCSI